MLRMDHQKHLTLKVVYDIKEQIWEYLFGSIYQPFILML